MGQRPKVLFARQVEGSMLQAMSGRHPITKDKKGRAFLDRNPAMFELVLNYLRTDLPPEGLDKTRQMMFEAELWYCSVSLQPLSRTDFVLAISNLQRWRWLHLHLTAGSRRSPSSDSAPISAVCSPSDSVAAPPAMLTWKSSPTAELLNHGRTVKKTGAVGLNCNVVASRGFSSGVHEWTVRRDIVTGGNMVGVASFKCVFF
jgi:hypothetical protein